jgi:hypothetical protein
MTESSRRFSSAAVRRKRLFRALAILGVLIGFGLAGWYGWQRLQHPDYPLGARSVLVILILLNARQNLRQYRYAVALEELGVGRDKN